MSKKTVINKDLANKRLYVERPFDAPLAQVWKAWTEAELLDQWWAPKPYKAITKTLDFTEGGIWLYCMAGPTGDKSWCRNDFSAIETHKTFSALSNFCDEDGNLIDVMPTMYWKNDFSETETGSVVKIELKFDNDADLQKIIEMGFEGGFSMGLGNLDELLAK